MIIVSAENEKRVPDHRGSSAAEEPPLSLPPACLGPGCTYPHSTPLSLGTNCTGKHLFPGLLPIHVPSNVEGVTLLIGEIREETQHGKSGLLLAHWGLWMGGFYSLWSFRQHTAVVGRGLQVLSV